MDQGEAPLAAMSNDDTCNFRLYAKRAKEEQKRLRKTRISNVRLLCAIIFCAFMLMLSSSISLAEAASFGNDYITMNSLVKSDSDQLGSPMAEKIVATAVAATDLNAGNSSSGGSSNGNVSALFATYLAKSGFKGQLDPAYYDYINVFWLQFDPPSRAAHFGFAVIYLILMIIGYFGNVLVIFMFLRFRSLRTPANTLVINLACSDFLMMLLGPAFVYNSLHEGPAVDIQICRYYGFVGALAGTASIGTLTAISIDRYNVVVYPLNPLRSTTKLRSRLMVLGVWVYALIFAIIPYLEIGLSKYVPEGYLTACTFEYLDVDPNAKVFMFVYFIFAWVLPLLIITYCYFFILRVVLGGERIQSSKDKSKTEIKLALVVIGLIGLWFLAWTPYAIVSLFGITSNESYLTPLGSMLPAVFCKTSACINPYLYAVNHPRFRSELRRLLGCPIEQRTSEFRSSYVSTRRNPADQAPDPSGRPKLAKLQRAGTSMDSDVSFTDVPVDAARNNDVASDSRL